MSANVTLGTSVPTAAKSAANASTSLNEAISISAAPPSNANIGPFDE